MNPLLMNMLRRYMAPAGDGGSDTGGTDTVDRGDDWTPTDDGPPKDEKDEAKDEAKDDEKDEAKDEAKDDEKDEAKDDEKDEAKDDEKDEKADKPKSKDTRIPLARHKEILQKEREAREQLEAKLAKYQGGAVVAATNDRITKDQATLLTLESEHAQLVVDGDHAKAAAKMGEIRRLETGIADAKTSMAIQAAEARAYERVRYDTTIERLEEAYPALNQDHEDYDAEKDAEVTELAAAYRTMGLTPAAAIQKAAKTLMGAATKKQTEAVDVKARVDSDDVAKQVAKDRKAAQVKKNLDASGKQPANTKGVGADSDKAGGKLTAEIAIRMPYNDFSKLDETTLAQMRGDEL